jgi:hypothetical protein
LEGTAPQKRNQRGAADSEASVSSSWNRWSLVYGFESSFAFAFHTFWNKIVLPIEMVHIAQKTEPDMNIGQLAM